VSSQNPSPAGSTERPWYPSPSTRPIPLPQAAGSAGIGGRRASDGVRRLLAVGRTPQGAGLAAICAAALVVLAVGLTTSPPSGVIDLDVADPPPAVTETLTPTPSDAAMPADAPPADVADPAAEVPVRLAVTGANAVSEIDSVDAAVAPGSLPAGCPPGSVRVRTPTGPLTIAPGDGVPVGVGLMPGAPDACRGATVVVEGAVTARGAGGQPVRLTATGSVQVSPSR